METQARTLHDRLIEVVAYDGCKNDSEAAQLRSYAESQLQRATRSRNQLDVGYWVARLGELRIA